MFLNTLLCYAYMRYSQISRCVQTPGMVCLDIKEGLVFVEWSINQATFYDRSK